MPHGILVQLRSRGNNHLHHQATPLQLVAVLANEFQQRHPVARKLFASPRSAAPLYGTQKLRWMASAGSAMQQSRLLFRKEVPWGRLARPERIDRLRLSSLRSYHRIEALGSDDRKVRPTTISKGLAVYEIEIQEMSEAFFPCWKAAGIHLTRQVAGGIQSWLRAHPYPPLLEHLSFRLGNQLFFIRVEDVDGKVRGPGSLRGVAAAATDANGRACILPMKKKLFGGGWAAAMPGWGLLDAETRQSIDPVALVSDEKIEMTPWEVHDMTVQVVRDYLESQGFQVMSWQGNPGVDPSIWFIGDTNRPEWVVVRSDRFPANVAERPSSWAAIAKNCARRSATGHFASVVVVSENQPFESSEEQPVPLWRGLGMHVRFTGLE
jgi:hypothetical protein